jgi:Icc-related predicted phosphoesterase
LLGEVLPLQLVNDILPQLSLPSGKIGVLLAGDFYTVPALDKRGGSGDVSDVWRAFADQFDWVAGVAGNHDTFGKDPNAAPRFSGKLHYLDHSCVCVDGLKVAGLGGIIGNPSRMRRRSEEEFLGAIESLLEGQPDVLLMHDGPDAPSHGFRGSPMVRQLIELLRPPLVVRGHAHWNEPFVELDGWVQVLNVDARVIILRDRSGAIP